MEDQNRQLQDQIHRRTRDLEDVSLDRSCGDPELNESD
jgi:hypothetical protein